MLAAVFPAVEHVVTLRLERSSDAEVWQAAADRGLILLTKDRDFESLALTRGAPPKVIVLALGNCTTAEVVDLLLQHKEVIEEFRTSEESLLILGA